MEDDDVAGHCAALRTQHAAMPQAPLAGATPPSWRILPRRSSVAAESSRCNVSSLRCNVFSLRCNVSSESLAAAARRRSIAQVPQRQTQGRWPKEYDNNPAYFSPSGGFGPPNVDGYRPSIPSTHRVLGAHPAMLRRALGSARQRRCAQLSNRYGISYMIAGENEIFFHVSANHTSKVTVSEYY